MSKPVDYYTPPLSDIELIDRIKGFVEAASIANPHDINVETTVEQQGPLTGLEESIRSHQSDGIELIKSASLSAPHCYLSVTVQPEGTKVSYRVTEIHDPGRNQKKITSERAFAIAVEVQKAFPHHNVPEELHRVFGEDYARYLRSRDATVEKTILQSNEIIRTNNAHVVSLTETFDKRNRELDERFSKKQAELTESIEEEREELSKRKQELDQREAELLLHDAKTARRESIKEMIDELNPTGADQEFAFQLSTETSNKRKFIHVAFCAVGLLLLARILASLAQPFIPVEQPPVEGKVTVYDYPAGTDVWNVAIGVAATVGFVAWSTFYIAWMKSWAEKHADEEIRLKRLFLDLRRTNLLIELLFEWHDNSDGKKESKELPPQILETLSRGLFQREVEGKSIEELQSSMADVLFGAASNLKLNVSGNEVELSRKATEKVAKKLM